MIRPPEASRAPMIPSSQPSPGVTLPRLSTHKPEASKDLRDLGNEVIRNTAIVAPSLVSLPPHSESIPSPAAAIPLKPLNQLVPPPSAELPKDPKMHMPAGTTMMLPSIATISRHPAHPMMASAHHSVSTQSHIVPIPAPMTNIIPAPLLPPATSAASPAPLSAVNQPSVTIISPIPPMSASTPVQSASSKSSAITPMDTSSPNTTEPSSASATTATMTKITPVKSESL